MPYLFTCPHCQTKTQVDDRYSGQAGECVTCGSQIHLPHFALGATETLPPEKSTKSAGWIVAAAVSVVILGCFLFAVLRVGSRTMTRLTSNREQTTSMRNLEKIAQALNAYAADHGSYPPPATTDANNAVLHSWRVLILPYLDEEELYNKFDLKLAWDHPVNMQVAYEVPSVFQHPKSRSGNVMYESAYYLVTGPGTLFPAIGSLGPDRITDDPSQTILVIEGMPLVPSGMWTEPIDLDFSRMQGGLGTNPGIEPGGLFEDGVAFSTADGRGHYLPNTTDPILVRSLVTPRGGERLADDLLD